MGEKLLLNKDQNGNVTYAINSARITQSSITYEINLAVDTEATLTVPPNCNIALFKYGSGSNVRFKVGDDPIPVPIPNVFTQNLTEVLPDNRLVIPGETLRFIPFGGSAVINVRFMNTANAGSIIIEPPPINPEEKVYVLFPSDSTFGIIDSINDTFFVQKPSGGLGAADILGIKNNTKLYISNSVGSSLSVIDPISNTLVLNFSSQGANPINLSYSPINDKLVVCNTVSADISLLDTISDKVIQVVPTGLVPIKSIFSVDESSFYVINRDGNNIIGYTTNDLTLIGQTGPLTSPLDIVANKNGEVLYVAESGTNMIQLISPFTVGGIGEIIVGDGPNSLALTPDSNLLFTVTTTSKELYRIEFDPFVISSQPVGSAPTEIIMNSAGTKLYIIDSVANLVFPYDIVSDTLFSGISVGTSPEHGTFNGDDTKLYISNNGSSNVSVIDTVNDVVLTTISTPFAPKVIKYIPTVNNI